MTRRIILAAVLATLAVTSYPQDAATSHPMGVLDGWQGSRADP